MYAPGYMGSRAIMLAERKRAWRAAALRVGCLLGAVAGAVWWWL